jgi:hypothetical protein
MVNLHTYITRVVRRPRPWLLLYGVTLVPALILALLLTQPLLDVSRSPLLREALVNRSLDQLIEVLRPAPVPPEAQTGPSFGALLIVPLLGTFLVVAGLLRSYLQGGTLATYAADGPLDRGVFWGTCGRWFGSFLLLNVGMGLAKGVGLVVGGILTAQVWSNSALGGRIALGVTLLLVSALGLWTELARAAAVARGRRRVGAALGAGIDVLRQRPGQLLGLVAGILALQAVVFGLNRLSGRLLPIPAWLASLLVQQVFVAARLGLRLSRHAGQVILAETA